MRSRINRGHPLACRGQASNTSPGGVSRRYSIASNSPCRGRPRPFLHVMAATNRARHPSGSSQGQYGCPSPWRPSRPRRTWVPPRVQLSLHRPVAADGSAPIPRWLARRAIRFLQTGDGDTASHSDRWLALQSPYPGLPFAVVTHTKQRATSNGLRSFRIWKQARASLCANALMATMLLVLAFFRT